MQENSYKFALHSIVRKYNKSHEIPLTKVTSQTLTHEFSTLSVEKKMNSKNLQYIMAHSSIIIMLDLYVYIFETGANVEMRSLTA